MKVIDFLKEYFNSANKIVFWISVISIVWTIGYMFFWIDMNPLFINADKAADITYTITTSIVASGIFYLFTIYFPKRSKLREIKNTINPIIDNINSETLKLFNKIFISNPNDPNDTKIQCFEQLNLNIVEYSDSIFIDCYRDPFKRRIYKQSIKYLITDLQKIQFVFSDYVSNTISWEIEVFKSDFDKYIINESNFEKEFLEKYFYDRYYSTYKQLYNIVVELNKYKLK